MIELEQREEVTILRMARGKGNAMSADFLAALNQKLDEVLASSAKALVLTGERSVFCAGVDLPLILEGGQAYLARFLELLDGHFRRLVHFDKPAIAAINGHAIAGGCIDLLACDYRVMSRGKGRVGLTELLVGVAFPTLAIEIVRHRVPAQHVEALCYQGRTVMPDEALAMGLIDELVDQQELLDRACAVAAQMAKVPAATFQMTKRQLRRPLYEAIERNTPRDDPEVRQIWASDATRKAIQGFVDRTIKRKA